MNNASGIQKTSQLSLGECVFQFWHEIIFDSFVDPTIVLHPILVVRVLLCGFVARNVRGPRHSDIAALPFLFVVEFTPRLVALCRDALCRFGVYHDDFSKFVCIPFRWRLLAKVPLPVSVRLLRLVVCFNQTLCDSSVMNTGKCGGKAKEQESG